MSEFKLEVSSDGTTLSVRAEFNINREKIMAETTVEPPTVESPRQEKTEHHSVALTGAFAEPQNPVDASSLADEEETKVIIGELSATLTSLSGLLQRTLSNCP